MKRPCGLRPQPPTLSQLGRDPPRASLRNGRNLTPRSCILQKENVLGKKTSAPMRRFRNAGIAYFSPSPRLPIVPWSVWAASGSVTLLLGCRSLQLETNSKRVLLRGEG